MQNLEVLGHLILSQCLCLQQKRFEAFCQILRVCGRVALEVVTLDGVVRHWEPDTDQGPDRQGQREQPPGETSPEAQRPFWFRHGLFLSRRNQVPP